MVPFAMIRCGSEPMSAMYFPGCAWLESMLEKQCRDARTLTTVT